MKLQPLARRLLGYPQLSEIELEAVTRFCDLARWLKADIASIQPSYATAPPDILPENVTEFLVDALKIDHTVAAALWCALRIDIWDLSISEVEPRIKGMIEVFLTCGPAHGIGYRNLRPPTRTCLDPACYVELSMLPGQTRQMELDHPLSHAATLFTIDLGPVPIMTTSLYCRGCKTRYHPGYYVHHQATLRTYYAEPPASIHVSTHHFVDADVCELFTNMMVFAWTSATNCARVYNLSMREHGHRYLFPTDWPSNPEVEVEHVWDAFFLRALLQDASERGTVLELPHLAVTQFERLLPALQKRNLAMAGPGQPQWSHACDLCCWLSKDEEGQTRALRSCVTDGVSIGHPCCAVHDCKDPVVMKKGARYCLRHSGKELECAVLSCTNLAVGDYRTCSEPGHRALDDYLRLENKAMFQLRRRLEQLNPSSKTTGATPTTTLTPTQLDALRETAGVAPILCNDNETVEPPADAKLLGHVDRLVDNGGVECDAEKSSSGNKRHRAQFGQRRTHNEELAVASCGVILGRATFMGSKAVNGVLHFWKTLFPTPASVPQVMWHDQNCRLWAVLQNADAQTRAHFAHCALPVDVFHFKCKHKETDVVCGTHCNPYIWPELRTGDGKWWFNSSAAEQANVWADKFQPIVREMQVDRYNFFLDEAIKRRNEYIVDELRRRGYAPYNIPMECLIGQEM